MDANSQHVKSIVETTEKGKPGKRRLKYASSRQRAKLANADVYRNYKRKLGTVTSSASTREERVHSSSQKRRKTEKSEGTSSGVSPDFQDDSAGDGDDDSSSTLGSELDVALDRNASIIFAKFHRELWPLVRSLPEVLHHASQIVDILLRYVLSTRSSPEEPDPGLPPPPPPSETTKTNAPKAPKDPLQVNLATTDIIHLLGVLARDLRHEIHPFLGRILQRLTGDLLNPPKLDEQPIPLDVTIVEAVFRNLSYIFRYDMEPLVSETTTSGNKNDKDAVPCLDSLRPFYSQTLAHRRDLIRRLAAESYAPLIRRLTKKGKKRHVRRVLRALAASGSSSSSSESPLSTGMVRVQKDAVDGISLFCFEITRGVAGRLHAKGEFLFPCLLDFLATESDNGKELVFDVTKQLMDRLIFHLDSAENAKMCCYLAKRTSETREKKSNSALEYMLRLCRVVVDHKKALLREESKVSSTFESLIKDVLHFDWLSQATCVALLELLCSYWKMCPAFVEFTESVPSQLVEALQTSARASESGNRTCMDVLVEDLLPFLPAPKTFPFIGPLVLEAALNEMNANNYPGALKMIHDTASTRTLEKPLENNAEPEFKETDDTLFLENAQQCRFAGGDRRKMMDACIQLITKEKVVECAFILRAVKVGAFLAVGGIGSVDKKQTKAEFSSVTESLEVLMRGIETKTSFKEENSEASEWLVVFGVALDALGSMSEIFLRDTALKQSHVLNCLKRVRPLAVKYLLARPRSMWALKSVDTFVSVCEKFGLSLSTNSDQVFEALLPNLRDKYHFRRLHALRILASFPKKSFVVDHADVDLTDDLDEEHSELSTKAQGSSTPTGPCLVLDYLLAIENAKIDISQERVILSMISQVEVVGRTGKMPVIYAELAASHLLGILNIKFSPVWKASISALIALCANHEASMFPHVHDLIAHHTNSSPYHELDKPEATSLDYLNMCRDWETSGTPVLFAQDIRTTNESGRISRHQSTDEITVSRNAWEILGAAPQLLTKHSRSLVPLVFDFLHFQYFSVYARHPDARELGLGEHAGVVPSWHDPSRHFNRKVIESRLVSILKTFASVRGPEQLFKHKVLFSVFTSFVGDRDGDIARFSLSCVLRYKVNHLNPYSEYLQKCLSKGKLKEALLELKSADETNEIDDSSRSSLLCFISRLLLGRLLSRSGSKSSKDSPAARRTAVLGFIAHFAKDDSDLNPLLYLTIRGYVPLSCSVVPVEDEKFNMQCIITSIKDIKQSELTIMPISLHLGFLNMLGAMLAQFGHRLGICLPAFLSLTLQLCSLYEVSGVSEESIPVDKSTSETTRAGSIRSQCYRCLGELLTRFDFEDLQHYLGRLRTSLSKALPSLKEMCETSDTVPSLLHLLYDLSSKSHLMKIFVEAPDWIPLVAKCLSPAAGSQALDTVLGIIENLLEAEESGSLDCVSKNINSILEGFKSRLTELGVSSMRSARRELNVLSRVSNLVAQIQVTEESSLIVDRLWHLLVPYLRLQHGCNDEDKSSILQTLSMVSCHLQGSAGKDAFDEIAPCFGPQKSKPGIQSKTIREELAGLAGKITEVHYKNAAPCSTVLKRLCSRNKDRVDEIDQDAVVGALLDLESDDGDLSWKHLSLSAGSVMVLLPIVNTCYHLLHSDDGIASRASFKALKKLVQLSSSMAFANPTTKSKEKTEDDSWGRLFDGTVVRLLKDGISSRNESPRRFAVLLLSELVRCCSSSKSEHHFGDLLPLCSDNEPDTDFFRNITHVQLHRRARAYQRLRKLLAKAQEENKVPFSPHSVANVLLPLCLNPIYEFKQKIEEALVLEAIPTVGVLSQYLSWNKYSSTIWTALTQLERHPEQERFLISMVCSMLDHFHFDVCENSDDVGGSVWRALEKRIIPRVETLVTRQKKDRAGTVVKMIRSPVLLALQKLFQQFPRKLFCSKLPRLLTVVCGGLKSRDSDARETARTTMAKMVISMDMEYLVDVVRELATALTEGYQLHVRSAVIHTILLGIAEQYTPGKQRGNTIPAFDTAIPGLVDLIQEDLFGVAQERKDAEGSHVRYVKEASGTKSANSLELIASILTFCPSLAMGTGVSSVHTLVYPFFERLRHHEVSSAMSGRLRDYLTRIVTGLSRNPSVSLEEVLPFAAASIEPFLARDEIASVLENDFNEETENSVVVSGSPTLSFSKDSEQHIEPGVVVEWRPSVLKNAGSAREARKLKKMAEKNNFRVLDGASAPKLTGSFRPNTEVTKSRSINDVASSCAILFGLQLLHSSLKRRMHNDKNFDDSCLDRFVPLLTTCVCVSRDNDVILSSIKCLGIFLRLDLPTLGFCSKSLASKTLELLTSTGSSRSHQEMLQACFKMLTFLMNFENRRLEKVKSHSKSSLLLDSEQMKVMFGFLKASIVDSDQHNSALNLIKTLMARSYVSPELYDMMEVILEQCVRSPKASLRQQCSDVFVKYLLNYPMSEERIEQHLRQATINTNYEYSEGRLSGIVLLYKILEKLPKAVLEEHVSMMFLPLALQLVNDESKECRSQIAECISVVSRRCSRDVINNFFQYCENWLEKGGQLVGLSLQVLRLVVASRPDVLRNTETCRRTLLIISQSLKEAGADWQARYFALLCFEKAQAVLDSFGSNDYEMWCQIAACMGDKHPWVGMAASRIFLLHVSTIPPTALPSAAESSFLVNRRGSLFEVARNCCRQLDFEENEEVEELTVLTIKSLSWIVQAMVTDPSLCSSTTSPDDPNRDPVRWLITRLSNTARPKGTRRRQAIYKCFAALATECSQAVSNHLPLVLEALHRSDTEAQNETSFSSLHQTGIGDTQYADEAKLAQEVLQLLEETYDKSDSFMASYAAVRKKAFEKREKRKLVLKTEAITNPQAAAARKMQKQDREKQRRKRRVDGHRKNRNGTAKRFHVE